MKEVRFNDKLWFGKYKGKRISDIIKNDPNFIQKLLRDNKIKMDAKTTMFFEDRCGSKRQSLFDVTQHNLRVDVVNQYDHTENPLDGIIHESVENEIVQPFEDEQPVGDVRPVELDYHDDNPIDYVNHILTRNRTNAKIIKARFDVPDGIEIRNEILDTIIGILSNNLMRNISHQMSNAERNYLNELIISGINKILTDLKNYIATLDHDELACKYRYELTLNTMCLHRPILEGDFYLTMKNLNNNTEHRIDSV